MHKYTALRYTYCPCSHCLLDSHSLSTLYVATSISVGGSNTYCLDSLYLAAIKNEVTSFSVAVAV